nr:ribonuclease H-like domain-containing protein [Tanacetum cinerariifolium]
MKDGIFFNQSNDIKEMLKKFELEDSKPTKTPILTEIKLTKDDEADSVDCTKYRDMIGLWYPKETRIETIDCADSNHMGDYVDRKSTSGICTFMGCGLTSWFVKKQVALSISTTEVEYVFVKKACQQALWMEQALIDDDIRLDGVPITRNSLKELFTQQEEMELETTQTSTIAKLPMLKQGDYEMWRLRIEQYFRIKDYAPWDVIENGNSFMPVTQTTTVEGSAITTTISSPVTAEEKIKKKNDVKPRSMLLMALPNEYLMTFNQYKDAKSLFASIETRFGGNKAIKKTQKTLLKQMYKNFSAPSTESLGFIFNRLQKIVSQLAVLDTMSIDDLYNNFKIIEQEVKRTASSNSSSQNMAFVSYPSTNSTNDVYIAYGVSTASTQSSTASTKVNTASSQMNDEVPTNMALMAFSDSEPEFKGYGPKTSNSVSEDISNKVKESLATLLVKELVLDDKLEKKTVFLTVTKIEFVRPKQQENQLGNQLSMLKCTGHNVLGEIKETRIIKSSNS